MSPENRLEHDLRVALHCFSRNLPLPEGLALLQSPLLGEPQGAGVALDHEARGDLLRNLLKDIVNAIGNESPPAHRMVHAQIFGVAYGLLNGQTDFDVPRRSEMR